MGEAIVPLRIEPLEEGGFLATSSVLPGLVAQGRTVAETVEITEKVARCDPARSPLLAYVKAYVAPVNPQT